MVQLYKKVEDRPPHEPSCCSNVYIPSDKRKKAGCAHNQQCDKNDPRNDPLDTPACKCVEDVPAVELADRKEIERCDEHPEPSDAQIRIMVHFIHRGNELSSRKNAADP